MPRKEYVHEGGPRRVHRDDDGARGGNVVFEAFTGMNPADMRTWVSASKTTTGLLTTLLERGGLFGHDDPAVEHGPELECSARDDVSFRASANVTAGLDIEDTE